jgi:hypothetical protein
MNEAYELCKLYEKHEGSKLLMVLLRNPNRPIFSTVLEIVIHSNIELARAEASVYHPSAVPMTDYKTIVRVKSELVKLIDKKAAYLAVNDEERSPYDDDIKSLKRYYRETCLPNGTPKSFPDEYRRAYRRHYAAIRRLFARAKKDGHAEAVAIVKRQLRLGRQSIFKTEE